MPNPARMSPADTALLVVDVQEKLIDKIHGAGRLVRNLEFLVEACQAIGVPIQVTEQYPKGLGATVASLTPKLPKPWEKTDFSCCGVPELLEYLDRDARRKVVVAGIETHVCVLQTVLDLLTRDVQVFVAVDAVGSRYPQDHDLALRRMEQAGAILTTCETAAFECMGGSRVPCFKQVSQLVQQRMKNLEPGRS